MGINLNYLELSSPRNVFNAGRKDILPGSRPADILREIAQAALNAGTVHEKIVTDANSEHFLSHDDVFDTGPLIDRTFDDDWDFSHADDHEAETTSA